MKNSTKLKMEQLFLEYLENSHPDLPEHERRNIAHNLTGLGMTIVLENSKGLSDTMQNALIDLESHRKMFRDHIDDLQVSAKTIIQTFKKNGMVTFDQDPKTRKTYLRGRTTVITETVAYMNKLNDFVIKFYESVYKIDSNDKDNNIQTTLF